MKNQAGTQAVVETPAAEAPIHEDFDQQWREAAAAAETAIASGEVTPVEEAPEVAEAPTEGATEAGAEEQPTEGEPAAKAKPTPQEAFQNREWRRQEKAKLQEQYDAAADQLLKRAERALELESAYKRRDFEGVAKALGAQNWRSLIMEHLETEANPERRDIAEVGHEVRTLREEMQREKEELARERQRLELQTSAQQQERTVQAEIARNKAIPPALAQNPEFVQAVLQIQDHYWDEKKQETIPTDQAAQIALDNLRKAHARLNGYFGGGAAETSDGQDSGHAPGAPETKKRAPTAIPQRQGTDAARQVPVEELPEKEWFAHIEGMLKTNREKARSGR
jgi:hypothetical protein